MSCIKEAHNKTSDNSLKQFQKTFEQLNLINAHIVNHLNIMSAQDLVSPKKNSKVFEKVLTSVKQDSHLVQDDGLKDIFVAAEKFLSEVVSMKKHKSKTALQKMMENFYPAQKYEVTKGTGEVLEKLMPLLDELHRTFVDKLEQYASAKHLPLAADVSKQVMEIINLGVRDFISKKCPADAKRILDETKNAIKEANDNFKQTKPEKSIESHTLGLSYTQTTVVLGAMRGVKNRDMQLLIVAESVKICGNLSNNIDQEDLKRKRDCWKVSSSTDSRHSRSKQAASRTVLAQEERKNMASSLPFTGSSHGEPSQSDVSDNVKLSKKT